MDLSTDSFPTSLPTWIRDWAIRVRDGHPESKGYPSIVLPEDLLALWRLLSDAEVAEKIGNLERQKASQNPRFQEHVFELLVSACAAYRQSKLQMQLPGQKLEKQLDALANSARRLAENAGKFSYLLQEALNSKYLTDRAKSNAPANFSRRKRRGLRKGLYAISYPDAPALSDLLLAFSDDVDEEIVNLKRPSVNSDGGDEAPIRYQIRKAKTLMWRLFEKQNTPLIAAMLSTLNEMPVSEDRVKKSKLKREKLNNK